MDRRIVLTKTAKGLMEITGKTALLSRDLRQALAHVDGKATVGDLHTKMAGMPHAKLNELLRRLVHDGFVREFVTAPNSRSPSSQMVLSTRAADLDFSEYEPTRDKQREADEQAREAEEIAAQMREQQAREVEKLRRAEEDKKRQEEEAAAHAAAEEARRESEEKARKETEQRAKSEAEEKARREAEEKAKQVAAEKAQREAEEKARKEAEQRAKREAAENARREAEEKAKRAAAEKAQREAEEKTRRETETKTRKEIEKAKREAEAKARAEAALRAQRDADERKRLEEEEGARRAEAAARAAHEAQLRAVRDADEQARQDAAERARRQSHAEAMREEEARARRHVAERVHVEEAAEAAREAEELAAAGDASEEPELVNPNTAQLRVIEADKAAYKKMIDEERAKAKAEAEEAARQRREARAKERAEVEARAALKKREREKESAEVATRIERIRSGKSVSVASLGKWFLGVVVVGALGAVAALPFYPVDVAALEARLSRELGIAIDIGDASYAWTPWPGLELHQVKIGQGMQVAHVQATPSAASWVRGQLSEVRLNGARVQPQALAAILKLPQTDLVQTLHFSALRIEAPGMNLPPLEGRLIGASESFERTLELSEPSGTLKINLVRDQGESLRFQLQGSGLGALIQTPLPLTDIGAKGRIGTQEVVVESFDGRLYEGLLKGQGVLRWDDQWRFTGTVEGAQIDVARFLPSMQGRLRGNGALTLQGDSLQTLFATPTLAGVFTVEKGHLTGFDLTRWLNSAGGEGGKTGFNELSGQASLEGGKLKLRAMRLQAGMLNASGNADYVVGKNIEGRIAAEMKMPSGMLRANMGVTGVPEQLQIKR